MKVSHLATFLALSGVAVLPACSMFGGNSRQASTATKPSSSYTTTPNYNSSQQVASNEVSPDMIRKVQQNLKDAGLYKGRVDGVWGPQTGSAVRDYQQQHNINASGQLDQPTLDAMNLGANNANQSNAAGQNEQNGGAQQTYGSNANAPNNNGQPNYNPPPPNNTNNNGNNTNSTP